ncbi:BNR-4 repeat-containing protein [Catenovulum adriaticum]|uniref:BNR repeat-containing protein n=1 Tax=Catenovulum adriaticum TaxID=2984846 RepID=A0ABY7AUC5_9ALTE|nr:BNR-4 repeat-containing protein [Catenovulum sp. TS8]WAJ71959.1 BNR repeat-containing protein [Catenovulum sp. TS8]
MRKSLTKLTVISAISTSLLLSACSHQTEQTMKAEQTKVDYFADNALGNALAVVQHPAGIHLDGVTYVSYQGPLEDPYVASYNHKTKKWQGPFKAGISELGKSPDQPKKIDNHGKPTMLIDDLGYVHIFFGGHGGDERHGKNKLGNIHFGGNKHAVSKRPYDISEWEALDNISPFGTYNQAVKMDNGDIYIFYRHGAHRSDWVYQKSTDNGRTFEPAVSFLKHKKRTDIKANDSWYAWVGRGQGDDIIVSYDYHICWNGKANNGRGHTTERHDAYYMVFNTKTGSWRNVQGDQLQIPVTRETADEKTLVARTGGSGYWTFNGSAHLDENGYPHIATNIGKDLGAKTGGPKQTSYFRWNGNKWEGGNPVNVQSRINHTDTRGDFIVKSPTEVSFILGYQEDNDGVISYFDSHDGGKNFTKGEELLRRENANWALTTQIKNAHPDARLIVAEKQKGTNWRKVYLVGDNGPIKRNETESQLLTDQNKARLP